VTHGEHRCAQLRPFLLTIAAIAWRIAAPPLLTASEVEQLPSCGVASLYATMRTLRRDVSVAAIQEQFQRQLGREDLTTVSLAEISQVAESYGLHTAALRAESGDLRSISMPAILYLRYPRRAAPGGNIGHFVVVRAATARQAELIDLTSPHGWRWTPIPRLRQFWRGEALAVSTKPVAVPSPWLRHATAYLSLVGGFAIVIVLWRALCARYRREQSDASNTIRAGS
jgi:ABC-type bacteriocin/lantibiotic exporter with double-glycine peptidase domain